MKSLKPRIALAFGAALAVLAVAGCGGKLHALLRPNQPPVATLSATRLPTASADSAAFELSWSGNDPEGRIDHYLIALDPRSLAPTDPAWQPTRDVRRTYGFAARPARAGPASAAVATPVQHVFALRAVDANGEESPVVWRTLSLTNIPPSVQILSPQPAALFYALVPPSFHITWTGNDPDGAFTQKPVKYKFWLFKDTDAVFGGEPIRTDQFDLALQNPDSLRRHYAPAFAGWDSVPGETTFVDYANLVPNSRYLFVLVGFDEAGDYNPVFSRNTNMLQMLVTFAGSTGPVITMINEYFNYTYPSGGYNTDPSRYVDVQAPDNRALTFHWSGQPLRGSQIAWYRWALDMTDLADQTPRINELTDLNHWSQRSLVATSATFGPFPPLGRGRQIHLLYIEAADNNGLVSLGIVRLRVVSPPFTDENSLLIVDDTRLLPDNLLYPPDPTHPDSLAQPPGAWPSAAELDTFLFARGGVRWRMTPNGRLSPPGIFAGYQYDTVSAQFLTGGLPLTMLNQYRHVLWLTEQNSATGNNPYLGRGALRQMCDAGRANLLAAYVKQGGQLWIAGGAAGVASTIAWNDPRNDAQPPYGIQKFSSTSTPGRLPELQLGRFMYDFAHWQSGFFAAFGQYQIVRSTGAAGGWPGAPNYALLPAQLRPKIISRDPLPPFRSSTTFFGATRFFGLEYLSEPNPILEDVDPDPTVENLASKLDTLFEATNTPLPQPAPSPYVAACMTYYHGSDNGAVVFSGFDLWTFTRPDLITLADFVLQEVWHLPRDPVARAPGSPPLAGRPTLH